MPPLENIESRGALSPLGTLSYGAKNLADMLARQNVGQNQQAQAALNNEKTAAQTFENQARRQGYELAQSMMPQQGAQINTDPNGVMTAGDTPWTDEQNRQRLDIQNIANISAFGEPKMAYDMTSDGQRYSKLTSDIVDLNQGQEMEQTLAGKAGLLAKSAAEGKTTAMQNLEARGLVPGTPEYQTAMEVDMTNGTPMYDADGNFAGMQGGSGGWGRRAQGAVEEDALAAGKVSQELTDIGEYVDEDLFEYWPNAKNWIANKAQKLGIQPNESQSDFTTRKKGLFGRVAQVFNAYRKDITGAAAAMVELERLEKDFINSKQSYGEFVATMNTLQDVYKRNLQYYEEARATGQIPRSNPETGKIEAPPNWKPGQKTITSQANAAAGNRPPDQSPVYRRNQQTGLPERSVDGGQTWR